MDIIQLGKIFSESKYFNVTPAQAIAKIKAGEEMGIAPVASMSIEIAKGKMTIPASIQAGLVKKYQDGKYNYRVIEHTNEVCKIEFYENDKVCGISEFAIKDAKQAKLLSGKNSHSWKNYPRNMLLARAISNGVKWYCPDVLGGPVYTPEELDIEEQNVDTDGFFEELEMKEYALQLAQGNDMPSAIVAGEILEAMQERYPNVTLAEVQEML